MRPRKKRVRAKNPRTFNSSEVEAQWRSLREEYRIHLESKFAKINEAKGDTAKFFSEICHLKPFAYQVELAELYRKNQLLAVRWPRQTGKSTSIGGLLLQDAYENSDLNIGFIGPSWRQTKLNLRRVAGFCRNLPPGTCHIQRTRITFKNGSVIEAFPNNPDTIRGNTFHRLWWDETNFTSGDDELYDAILFTLGTTNGKLVASSTPFNTDSLFWRMCNHKDYSDFVRHHFSYEKALAPNGPLNTQMIERIRRQFGDDPARWRREMEAEWAEDEDVWLSQNLIAACIGTAKNCGEDLQELDCNAVVEGEFYVGLDPAQTKDFHVMSVVERVEDRLLLRHLKIFPHPTYDAYVLGYIKALQDRLGGFRKLRVDITRESPSFIADMENAGINNAEGVVFGSPRKSEMAGLLKKRMGDKRFLFPLLTWEKPYRGDICNEFNVERFALRKDGGLAFSHPQGTHDDVFWACALAVYATVAMETFDPEAAHFG
ncbi:MAG TPA: terminase family protein [Candidatus Binatia bacterium]|nr:terminase family protein [Candidatus Binatia bacterium]